MSGALAATAGGYQAGTTRRGAENEARPRGGMVMMAAAGKFRGKYINILVYIYGEFLISPKRGAPLPYSWA